MQVEFVHWKKQNIKVKGLREAAGGGDRSFQPSFM